MSNENDNNFLLLNSLAMNCLDREEYASFLTVMKKIRDRSIPVLEFLKDKEKEDDTNQIRYPHDIELILQYKIFQNNQKGERVQLSKYSEIPILIKIPLDKNPEDTISNIYNYIIGINK